MSGAVAAHASYNGSGTQGLAVTNKINSPDGDVMSVFWNKNDTTRQLLYGSSTIEIASSGTGGSASFGGSQVFTVNNDIDCLGDMYVAVTVKVDTSSGRYLDPYFLAKIINRVEFQVGTQVWQTLENKDILAINKTELGEGQYQKMAAQANGFLKEGGIPVPYSKQNTPGKIEESGTYTCYLHLPILTKTLGPELQKFSDQVEDGYLMAAAPHQTVKIKLYYAHESELTTKWKSRTDAGLRDQTSGVFTGLQQSQNAYQALSAEILNVESETSTVYTDPNEDIAVARVARLTALRDAAQADIVANGRPVLPPFASFSELDVKLYAQHMIMCNEEREQMKAQPQGIPKRIKMTQNVQQDLKNGTSTINLDHFSLYASHLIITTSVDVENVELLLNSSSFSGIVPSGMLTSPAASALGLYNNSFYIGPKNYDAYDVKTYIFPLASRAYGGSSVPLNRFDNIRLKVNLCEPIINTALGGPIGVIDVTCVGETSALYQNGAASLAMY